MSTEKISLKIASEYKYLRQSNCYTITGVDDAERFRVVTVCFWLPIFLHIAFFLRFFLFCVEIIFFTYEFAYGSYNFQEALDIVHVSKEDQESVFSMLAAVLWLGNVSFSIVDNENHVEPLADEGKILAEVNVNYIIIVGCLTY